MIEGETSLLVQAIDEVTALQSQLAAANARAEKAAAELEAERDSQISAVNGMLGAEAALAARDLELTAANAQAEKWKQQAIESETARDMIAESLATRDRELARLKTVQTKLLTELLSSPCPGGGWNGMPNIEPTVQACMDALACGCSVGDAIALALRTLEPAGKKDEAKDQSTVRLIGPNEMKHE